PEAPDACDAPASLGMRAPCADMTKAPHPRVPPLAPGKVVNDRYEIRPGLGGTCSMGQEFLAWDRATEQTVLLEVVCPAPRSTEDRDASWTDAASSPVMSP